MYNLEFQWFLLVLACVILPGIVIAIPLSVLLGPSVLLILQRGIVSLKPKKGAAASAAAADEE
jgi:hypothetical protein